MSLTIRPARWDDRPALYALHAEVQRIHQKAEAVSFKPPVDDYRFAEFLRAALSTGGHHLLLAENADEPVGYLYLIVQAWGDGVARLAHRCLLIDQIVVADRWRRQGFGRQMIDFARDFARRANCAEMILSVWTFNEDAVAFYESLGFRSFMLSMRTAVPPA